MSKHDENHFLGGFWGVYLQYRNNLKLKLMKTKTKRNILRLAIAAFLTCSIVLAWQIKNDYRLTEWVLAAMFVLIIILAPLMAWWESDLVKNS
jgi:uncharacterized membrane protein YqjE